MAEIRVWRNVNYVYVVDENGVQFRDHAKNVVVSQSEVDGDLFTISSDRLGNFDRAIADIKNEADESYTAESFLEWADENTGNFSTASGGSEVAKQGSADYSDTATAITPIVILKDVFSFITNNALGINTDVSNLPDGVTVLWDASNNQFDFSQLSIGSVVHLRFDLNIVAPSNNSEVLIAMDFAIGGVPFTLNIARKYYKYAGTYTNETFTTFFYIKNANMMNFPAKPKIRVDDATTLVVNGWLCDVYKK